MATTTIYAGSDFAIELANAQDAATGTPLTTATVTYAIYKTSDGSAVAGATGSMTLAAGTTSTYRGVIESTITSTFSPGVAYFAIITLVQSPYDLTKRLDLIAQSAGELIIDADIYGAYRGTAVSSTDLPSVTAWCAAVRAALLRRLRPFVPEPQDAVTFFCDAPPTPTLILPVRPIRAITSVSVHWGANGDGSAFVAGDSLVNFADFYGPLDPLDGFNRSGILHKRSGGIWGVEYRYGYAALSPSIDPNRGAVKIVADIGEATVPDDIRAAASLMVTKALLSRKLGAQTSSASLNGASYSLPSQALAAGWLADPAVMALLQPFMTPRFG